jgi:hypothetical protein
MYETGLNELTYVIQDERERVMKRYKLIHVKGQAPYFRDFLDRLDFRFLCSPDFLDFRRLPPSLQDFLDRL